MTNSRIWVDFEVGAAVQNPAYKLLLGWGNRECFVILQFGTLKVFQMFNTFG